MSKQRETKEQVNNMLQALGERVLRALQGADDAYAGAVLDKVYPKAQRSEPGHELQQLGAVLAGQPVLRGMPEVRFTENDGVLTRMGMRAQQVGVPVANVATRYGMPIAGVTAAGMGIAELAQALSREEGEGTDALVRIQ